MAILIIVFLLIVGVFIARTKSFYSRVQTTENITSKQKFVLLGQFGLFIVWCLLMLLPRELKLPPFQLSTEIELVISSIIFGSISISFLVNRISIAEFIIWPQRDTENEVLAGIRATNMGILGLLISLVMGITGAVMLFLY